MVHSCTRMPRFWARTLLLSSILGLCPAGIQAQNPATPALNHALEFAIPYIQRQSLEQGLTAADIQDLRVTDAYVSRLSGNTQLYLRQAHAGIGIYGAELNICLDKNNEVVVFNNGAFPGIAEKITNTVPLLTPEDAIRAAALHYGWTEPFELLVEEAATGSDQYTVIRTTNFSEPTIPVRLVYQMGADDLLHLCWDLSLYLPDGSHWWSLRIDARSGNVLDENDWMLSCDFGPADATNATLDESSTRTAPVDLFPTSIVSTQAANTYNVFDMPIESPSHGARSLVTSPWNLTASPFGWHDTNGSAGAEFTITRGNNVLTQDDINGNDGTGYSPDGGPTLDFDFPLNLSQSPVNYLDAALTNLFFWNNRIHDYTYLYGFDEVSGNFQQNNYGNGGTGGDYVLADGQDGSGTNNANFATPADGANPRMQMFLWSVGTQVFFTVNSPSAVAGNYTAVEASFGPGLSTTPLTQDLVLVDDPGNLACATFTNAAALTGKIALVNRGT